MGTRGLVTFVTKDGVVKSAYNQYDAYPEGVGTTVLSFVRAAIDAIGSEALAEPIEDLIAVEEGSKPTLPQRVQLAHYADTNVSTGRVDEWYVLLRKTQGNPALILQAGYVEDQTEFGNDSLFCEWAYAINMQDNTFEVYEGFQKTPATKGLWAGSHMKDGYGSVERVAVWPLNDLPSDEEFLRVAHSAAIV